MALSCFKDVFFTFVTLIWFLSFSHIWMSGLGFCLVIQVPSSKSFEITYTRSMIIKGRPRLISDITTFSVLEFSYDPWFAEDKNCCFLTFNSNLCFPLANQLNFMHNVRIIKGRPNLFSDFAITFSILI